MIDYLLKFPDRATAFQFGVEDGFASINDAGEEQIIFASHEYSLHLIGEHNGSDWWVLFRDLVDRPVPDGVGEFIVWRSDSGEPRPTDESVPDVFWA